MLKKGLCHGCPFHFVNFQSRFLIRCGGEALYQTVQTTKVNLEKLLGSHYSKFKSLVAIRFNLLQVFLCLPSFYVFLAIYT